MKNTKHPFTLKLAVLVVLILGAVYFISTYTRKHEEKGINTPTLTEAQRSGNEKLKQ